MAVTANANASSASPSARRERRRPGRRGIRPLPASARVLTGAAAVVALHWVDGAFVDPWRGERAGRGLPAAAAAVLLTIAAAVLWPRLPRGMRALTAFTAGLVVLACGVLAATAVWSGETEGGAWSGLLQLPAGAAMLCCAVATLRGAPRRRRFERWGRRALGTVLAVLAVTWVVTPVAVDVFATGKPRTAVPVGALGLPHADVAFRSTDGIRLRGWYVASRNGAAVVVLHGGGGSRAGAVLHARMLARHGYGVLLYDERGRGESDGAPDAIGWTWRRDVAGALAWLAHRPGVDPSRIGGLGLSTGAEALFQAAAERGDLHAVVADGLEARSMTEARRAAGLSDLPYWSVLYAANRVLTAAAPAPDLARLAGRLRAPALIVATGRGPEARFGRVYAERAGARAQLWSVPDAGHTQALRTHPRAYESRVIAFLDGALRPRGRRAAGR